MPEERDNLERLMGMALFNPTIAQQLLSHDPALLDDFQFSSFVQTWLLSIQAQTLEEYAEILLSKLREQAQTNVREIPTISIIPEEVKQAALTMRRIGKPLPDISLQELFIVEEFLNSPYWPLSSANRQLALQYLLARVITEEFTHRCEIFGIPEPEPLATLDAAKQTIALIMNKGGQHLKGWTWLYYGYVRIDLELTPTSFAEMTCIHPRNLRRYQEIAIQQLTEKLIVLENQARLRRTGLR